MTGRQEYDRTKDRQRILGKYMIDSGFGPRVRARALRAPVILISLSRPTGRCAPPPPKNLLFPETKCFPSGLNSSRQGRIFFHWATLHPTELHCILLSYAAPFEIRCTLLSYAAPCELRYTLLSYAAFN